MGTWSKTSIIYLPSLFPHNSKHIVHTINKALLKHSTALSVNSCSDSNKTHRQSFRPWRHRRHNRSVLACITPIKSFHWGWLLSLELSHWLLMNTLYTFIYWHTQVHRLHVHLKLSDTVENMSYQIFDIL